jgi:V8-like Glu-specific endopeptidase
MTTIRKIQTSVLGLALSLVFVACGGGVASVDETSVNTDERGVVYGTDNRMDVYAHPDATLRLRAQESTVALMSKSTINASNPNNVRFSAETLGSAYGLCSSERFRDDPTAAFCSGTLIDDDLVLTAGHCITNSSDCSDTRFVFNYYRTGASSMQTVTTADIFACASIVVRKEGYVGSQKLDYAVVKLDRPATPRFTPAPVRLENVAMSVGQNVAVIGSGSGIPFKIDSGGSVRDARASVLDWFEASTDTFGGNSGSGVYETSSHKVVGILVRGDTDYRSNGGCYVVNVCSESGCNGEGITYVYPALAAYCASHDSARLCGTPTEPTEPTDPAEPGTSESVVENLNGSVAKNASQHFGPFSVVSGSTFQVVMSGSGDPDLYVRFGSKPTTSAYDCRPYKAGASETCSLVVPSGVSSAFVMVRGYSAATFDLQVSYTKPGTSTPTEPTEPEPAGEQTVQVSGSVAKGEFRQHEVFAVAAGSTFRVVMSGTGDPDLYVRFGFAPTTSAYNCRPYRSGATEECTLTVPAGETQAFVGVRGYTASTYTLAVTYTAAGEVAPTEPSTPTVQTAQFGGSLNRNETRSHGPLTVVPGSTFRAVMSGSGDADLYVRFGSAPTTSAFDCRPYLTGSAEECTLTVPAGQTQAFLAVRGYTASTYSLAVTYTAP